MKHNHYRNQYAFCVASVTFAPRRTARIPSNNIRQRQWVKTSRRSSQLRTRRNTSYIKMEEERPSRSTIIRSGVDAAVEDFVKSGMNVCVGDGPDELMTPLLSSLAARVFVQGLIDIAIISNSPNITARLKELNLPSDMGVNFKKGIDLYIAPIKRMDNGCNAVLDTDDIAADRYAAEIADKVVLVIQEDDYNTEKKSLKSIPIQLTHFLPEMAIIKLKEEKQLQQLGVVDISLRKHSITTPNPIADVMVSENHLPQVVEEELVRLPFVQSVGLLPASTKTTAVVASNNLEPIDLSPSLNTIAELSKEASIKELEGDKKNVMISTYVSDWQIISGSTEALLKEFEFATPEQAAAFVRYVHYVARSVRQYPEIRHTYNRVKICVTSIEVAGITEMDTLFARELSTCYSKLTTPVMKSVY